METSPRDFESKYSTEYTEKIYQIISIFLEHPLYFRIAKVPIILDILHFLSLRFSMSIKISEKKEHGDEGENELFEREVFCFYNFVLGFLNTTRSQQP